MRQLLIRPRSGLTRPTSRWYSKYRFRIFPVLNLLCFGILITVSLLSWLGVINHQSVGDVRDKYSNAFSAAMWTCSMWGLIYTALSLWLVAHIIQGLFRKHDNELFNGRIGILFAEVCIAQSVWLILWNFEHLFAAAVVVSLAILAPLILIYVRLGIHFGRSGQMQLLRRKETLYEPLNEGSEIELYLQEDRTIERWEFWTVYVPFSLYLGWISVSTFDNWATAFERLFQTSSRPSSNPLRLSPQGWSALLQTALTLLTLFVFMVLKKDWVQPLVTMWALVGIAVRHHKTKVHLVSVINLSIVIIGWLLLVGYLVFDYRARLHGTSHIFPKSLLPGRTRKRRSSKSIEEQQVIYEQYYQGSQQQTTMSPTVA